MRPIRRLLCVASLTMAVSACDSPASSEDQAIEAQNEADRDRNEAIREAAEKTAEAEAKATAASVEARDEARRIAETSQAEANAAAQEANAEITKAHNELREWSRVKLEALDKAIERARVDASKKSTRVQSNFDEVMRDVDAQRVSIQQELATLDTRAADGWERFKTDYEVRMDALESRLKDARARL